ncbi:MAG: transaldolase [Corynebacterium sp.]|nr:transaldolase [Corynebacterium sp.]
MNNIDTLREIGTSTWLDDLSRERITSGNLAEIIKSKSVVGVTTNPAIFAGAMSKGSAYDAQIAEFKAAGADATEAVYAMAIDDVRAACDLFLPVFEATNGEDGRVSIEVDPRIAEDTEATIAQAKELWEKVGRPNAMIKIPATDGSLKAIPEVLGAGISVNVTLIFSVARYREVLAAYDKGIELAKANGIDPASIQSVASFFVSRVDTEIDKRLEAIGTPEALAARGKAGVANAQLAYAAFEGHNFDAAANTQRPLWASTSVKNPEYPSTLYVAELAGPKTVNTMPEGTIDAVLKDGGLHGDTLTGAGDKAALVFAELEGLGIDFDDVFHVLESEGVEKFVASWQELIDSMAAKLA